MNVRNISKRKRWNPLYSLESGFFFVVLMILACGLWLLGKMVD